MPDSHALPPTASSSRSARNTLSQPPQRWLLAAAVALLALGYAAIPHVPSLGRDPVGAAAPGAGLEQAVQRGALWVAVRSYPRPSEPDQPLAPEPDVLDAAFAQWLGKQAGLPVEFQDAQHADIQLQGFDPANIAQPAAIAYGSTQLQLVGRRQQLLRWAGLTPSHLTGLTAWWQRLPWGQTGSTATPASNPPVVCVGTGVAPRALWESLNMRVQTARSSIHAISDFLAGQCDLLAENPDVVQRLLQQASWRFYGPLGKPWSLPSTPASSDTAAVTSPSQQWLHQASEQWRRSSDYTLALQHRASTIVLEAALLEDGAICH